MHQFLGFLRRANVVLATALDRLIGALQVKRRTQTVAVIVAALLAAVSLLSLSLRASSAARRWTEGTTLIVASRALQTGEQLSADNIRTITLPVALAPADMLPSAPAGARIRIAVTDGTPVTASMIDTDAPAIPVPEGWRVVAMPVDVASPAIAPGDHVDVVSMDAVVAAGALVLSAGDTKYGPTIAVPQDAAAVVATAAGTGDASLVKAS